MKKTILIVAAMSLSACMGGGGDDVEVSLGSDFGTLLNNTRTASDLTLDSPDKCCANPCDGYVYPGL